MIQVKNLSKNFSSTLAISGLNFSIKKGEVIGLLGPNGAGKTTTLKILAGLLIPSEGDLVVNGIDGILNPKAIQKDLGYLPETPPLYLDMNVGEYLSYVINLKNVTGENKKIHLEELLKKTNLHLVRKKQIKNLSKGFKQRVGLAQALVGSPSLLILDEPTVGLDPQQIQEMRSLIQELKRDHTIIISTHILSEVEATCDRILVLNEGKLVLDDQLNAVLNRQKQGLRLLVESLPSYSFHSGLMEQLKVLKNVSSCQKKSDSTLEVIYSGGEMTIAEISKFLIQKDVPLIQLTKKEMGLEDLFLKTVGYQQPEVNL